MTAWGHEDQFPRPSGAPALGSSRDLRQDAREQERRAESGHGRTTAPEDLLRRISVGGLP